MAGEYRQEAVLQKLPLKLATAIRNGLRIGLTSQPIVGCTVHKELADEMSQAYAAIGETKYADGLKNGTMVPLVPNGGPDRHWAPGELFFTS